MTIVVDTSAVLAAFDEDQAEHRQIAGILRSSGEQLLVVSPMVVAEVDYMLFSRLGRAAAQQFARDVAVEAYELASWDSDDQADAISVSSSFHDEYIGITDAANVVLADRYRTTLLLTLDRQHFRTLRPLWGADSFTLLPFDAN